MHFKVCDSSDRELRWILFKQGWKTVLLATAGAFLWTILSIYNSRDSFDKAFDFHLEVILLVLPVYVLAIFYGVIKVYPQFSNVEVKCSETAIEVMRKKPKVFQRTELHSLVITSKSFFAHHRTDGTPLVTLLIFSKFKFFRRRWASLKIGTEEDVRKLALEISEKYGLPLKVQNGWGISRKY